MGKMVGAAEFKAKCLALLEEVQASGVALTVTKRGKPVAIVSPVEPRVPAVFGMLNSPLYRNDMAPEEPAADPDDWEALR